MPTWTQVHDMHAHRVGHTATLVSATAFRPPGFPNSKPISAVLVAGGGGDTSAEAYQWSFPGAPTWTQVAPMTTARRFHTATLLPSGKVLVAGGESGFIKSAEAYDPQANRWRRVAPMKTGRCYHTATLLPLSGDKVLVAGGYVGSNDATNSAEVYDPSANRWTSIMQMTIARAQHTATLLPLSAGKGKVLVAGGYWQRSPIFSKEEVYDSSVNRWTRVAPLNTPRWVHTAMLLPNGKVLVVGGWGPNGSLRSVERYDPDADTWAEVAPLNDARYAHTATLLPSGKVLVAGGANSDANGWNALTSAEVYDPDADVWTRTDTMKTTHWYHTATLLPHGKVLVAGGYYISSAEVFG